MELTDKGELLKNYQDICRDISCHECSMHKLEGGCEVEDLIWYAPTVDAVPKDTVFHISTFDEMTDTHAVEELTLEELLDKYTDEGYPNALNALDALEDEDETF